jgi:hypothetical protein
MEKTVDWGGLFLACPSCFPRFKFADWQVR